MSKEVGSYKPVEERAIPITQVMPQVRFEDVQFQYLSEEKQAELKFLIALFEYIALKHANEKRGVKLNDARFENLQGAPQKLRFIRITNYYKQYKERMNEENFKEYSKKLLDEYRALDGGMKQEAYDAYHHLITEARNDKNGYSELNNKTTWNDEYYEMLRDNFHKFCQQSHIPDGIVLFDEIEPTDWSKTKELSYLGLELKKALGK